MCVLTEPVPAIMIDVLHPTIFWIFPAAALLLTVVVLVRLLRLPAGKAVAANVRAARRRALIACVLFVLAGATLAFVVTPSDFALKAWETRQEAALPDACFDTVILTAESPEDDQLGAIVVGLVFLPVAFGLGLLADADRRVGRARR